MVQSVGSRDEQLSQAEMEAEEERIIHIYLGLREHQAMQIRDEYPGWRMRIYSNILRENEISLNENPLQINMYIAD